MKNLDRFLGLAGLNREELYITNVSKVRAPRDKMDRMPYEELKMWEEDLIQEINDLPCPKVLIPMGNYALRALTNSSGITKQRGTPLHPKNTVKHDCVVIPTFHPISINYGEKYEKMDQIIAGNYFFYPSSCL